MPPTSCSSLVLMAVVVKRVSPAEVEPIERTFCGTIFATRFTIPWDRAQWWVKETEGQTRGNQDKAALGEVLHLPQFAA